MARTNGTSRRGGGSSPHPNKSEAIREALAQNPKALTKEIVLQLAEKGIRVQPSLVYMVKSKQQKRQRRARREKERLTSTRTGSADPIALVLKTKALGEEAGGIKNLKMLVDLLAE